MKVQLAKWGNSLALRIPRSVAAAAEATEGTEVDVTVEHGAIVARPTRRFSLEELVDAITPENRHGEVDWGPSKGNEVW